MKNYCTTFLVCLLLANVSWSGAATAPPECPVYLPNVFSPNGDGLNDAVRPLFGSCAIAEYSLQVFTRWGQLVFETQEIDRGWDGRIDGSDAPAGVYALVLRYRADASERTETITGEVNLIR